MPPPKPRRAKGEGGYSYLPAKGLHRYRIDLGVGGDGKRHQREVTAKTQPEAFRKFQELRRRIERGE
jgi:hypothetical protein